MRQHDSSAAGRCRILYLAGELHKGGLERQLYYLIRAIDRERYEPAIAVWNYRDSDLHVPLLRALGVPIYSLSTASSRIGRLSALRRLVKELEPEVIHSYTFYTNFAASWGAFGRRGIAIGSLRGDFSVEKRGSGRLVGRLSARWPSYQISNSFSAAAAARSARSVFAPRQCAVVSNGLDLERFQMCPVATEGPVRILGLGYLLPAKRWERLLRAARELKRRGLDYDIRIVGDGPLRGALEQEAQRLDVADRVTFMAHSNDVPRLLAESSFLAHTSDTEGCPNAVMEAMSCGRAVVATDVGDVARLVDDGKTGFVVRPSDDSMLAERMTQLITDRRLRCSMGLAARRKAERDFGVDRLVRETLAAYRTAGWKEQDRGASRIAP